MTTPTPAQIQARRATFRQLHASGCFAIPNPWDLGSARYLAHLGFKALASTSSGCAWAHGTFDGGMALDAVLAHLRDMVAATDLPINADFENGFARQPAGGGAPRAPGDRHRHRGRVDRRLDRPA